MTVDQKPQTAREMAKQIPVRALEVVIKLLSYRTAVLGLTVWLVSRGFVGDYAFIVIAIVAVFGRDALKVVEKLKK